MSDALSPPQALAFLRELQPGLRAAAVLDTGGRLLAGEEPRADAATVRAGRGGYAVSVACGPTDLRALVRLDVEQALSSLAGAGGA